MDGAWLIVNCSCWTDVYPAGTISQCLYPTVTRLVPMQDYSSSAYTDPFLLVIQSLFYIYTNSFNYFILISSELIA